MSQVCVVTCPNCAGKISRQLMDTMVTCEHCGCEFVSDESMWELPVSDVSAEDVSAEILHDVSDFVENAPWREYDGTEAGIVTYNCGACGASLFAQQSAITAFCPYCGNNLLLAGSMSENVVFDSIVPFTIDERAAQASIKEFLKDRWYLPSDFKDAFQRLQAVYVPYYAIDVRVSGEAVFDCNMVSPHKADDWTFRQYRNFVENNHTVEFAQAYTRNGTTVVRSTDVKDISCSGEVVVRQIWVDASAKMLDSYMAAIAPFPTDRAVPFSASCIVGQMAQSPDVSYETCFIEATKQSSWFLEKHLALSLVRNVDVSNVMFEKSFEPHFETASYQLCLLPVWFSCCEYKGEQYLIAINGTTGRCVSELPRSDIRRGILLTLAAVCTAVSFVAAAVVFPLFMLLGFAFVLFAVLVTIVSVRSYDNMFQSQLSNTAKSGYTVGQMRVTDKKFERQR